MVTAVHHWLRQVEWRSVAKSENRVSAVTLDILRSLLKIEIPLGLVICFPKKIGDLFFSANEQFFGKILCP